MGRERGDRGQFIDQARDFLGGDFERSHAIALERDDPARFAGLRRCDLGLHTSAKSSQHVKQRRAGGIQSDVLDDDARPGQRGRRDEPEGRRGKVAGNRQRAAVKPLAAGYRDREPVNADLSAEGRQRALGVIACRGGFGDAGRAFRVQSGE